MLPFFLLFIALNSFGQGNLEIPQNGSAQSGVSVISGWSCDANRVEVSFNGGPLIEAAYGTTRNDTEGVCGDTDNGWGLLFAYSLLGAGQHTVVAYEDGVEFGRATFTVATMDEPFVRGLSGSYIIPGFPKPNEQSVIRWQEESQNFVISDIAPADTHVYPVGLWEAPGVGRATINLGPYTNGRAEILVAIHTIAETVEL